TTNSTNGTCKIEASNTNCQPCPLTPNDDKNCKIVACIPQDNNCSTVSLTLECKENSSAPVVMEPRPITPRTGGLELSLSLSGIMSILLGQFLIISTKKTKLQIDL
ncbi:MAG: hypothetical protein ACRCXZ_01200, partial [Patescibacteria group bacterium]